MRLLLAFLVVAFASAPPAHAARARDGFGTAARCHCDRYFSPRYTARAPRDRGSYAYRRY